MRRIILILFLLAVPLMVSGQLPPVTPAELSGQITIAGSPVLVPMTQNIATRFGLDGFLGNVDVQALDTTTALQRFCGGEFDIALADRQITPQEANACSANGRAPLGFRVASDAILILVSDQNTFLSDVDVDELREIFGTALLWSDVRVSLPGEPIARYGPATTSGEFQFFANVVFGGETRQLITAVGAQFSENTASLLQTLSGNRTGVGFFGAPTARNAQGVRQVAVAGIAASAESVANNTYPLTRPLYLYSAQSIFQQNEAAAGFINYYLQNSEVEIQAIGLFPPGENNRQSAINTWFTAVGQPPQTTPIPPQQTATPVPEGEVIIEATPIPTIPPTPEAPFEPEVTLLLINTRGDLELAATEVYGVQRPESWSGNLDINNPQMPILLRLDLELVANEVFGVNTRPENWFGAVSSTQYAIVRDVRHDLELLANQVFGVEARPAAWAGSDPILQCNRSTQALVRLLQRGGVYTVNIDPNAPDYCEQVETTAARFTEVNLLTDRPQQSVFGGAGSPAVPGDVLIDTPYAVAFLNSSATLRVGRVPEGEPVNPIGRSYVQFSNMTLVEGDGFVVFVDWHDTTLTEAEFRSLPDANTLNIEPFCQAFWCGG